METDQTQVQGEPCISQDHLNSLVELEAQMSSLLSLHNVTSDLPTPDAASFQLGTKPAGDVFRVPGDYVSVIKFNGQPIPPPVLSLSCRLEMQGYREAAIRKEQEIVERRRLKLLDTVQSIVDSIEVRKQASRENTPRNEICEDPGLTPSGTMMPDVYTDTERGQYKEAIVDFINKEQDILEGSEKSTRLRQLETRNIDKSPSFEEIHPPDTTHQPRTISQCLEDVPPSISSSMSTSTEGALNRTVVAAKDPDMTRSDTGHDLNLPLRSTAMGFERYNEQTEQGPARSEEDLLGKEDSTILGKFRESCTDSESNMSLLGEYQLLPTPTPIDNSDLSNTQPALDSDQTKDKSDGEIAENQTSTTADKDCLTVSATQTLSGTHSTQLTLDTVAQSCTLPLSLFSSCSSSNSTLCEVQDPFSSLTGVASPFEVTGEENQFTRRAPVGQESSNTESGSDVPVASSNNGAAINSSKALLQSDDKPYNSEANKTPVDECKSPRKRVRRNSYTLEHPSPALLDAKARNEAPYASDEGSPLVLDNKHTTACRSLDLGNAREAVHESTKSGQISRCTKDQMTNGGDSEPSSDQQKEATGLTEDNLLRLQLEQFEEIRRQLEQKQKEQLEEMLLRQQEEQLALQKEMAALELRVNQQNSAKIYSSVFGMGQEEAEDDEQSNDEGRLVESASGFLVKAKHGSDTTNPSLRDSLESALPPPPVFVNSHTSPAIHTHSLQLNTMDTSASHGNISEVSNSPSVPFYLDHTQDASIDLDYMEVERSTLGAWTPASDLRSQKIYSPAMQAKFERVSAAAKGYLTRRLMRTHRVQNIIKTIRDTVYFVDDFQAETPIKHGRLTPQDVSLAERLLSQLSTARNELYDTFQTLPAKDRMAIIAQSRALEQEQILKTQKHSPTDYSSSQATQNTRPLSAATLKVLERKNKANKIESNRDAVKQPIKTSAPKSSKRPKGVGDNRVLRPIQGNQSPSAIGAPFRFTASTASDVQKSKPVIHRHTASNKNIRNKAKSVPNSVATKSNATTGKKPTSVRRSLYPATKGPTKGTAKGPAKGVKSSTLNKK